MKVFAHQKISPTVEVLARELRSDALPRPLVLRPEIGLVTARPVTGRCLHRSVSGLYDIAGTVTPLGDYLIMFPDGGHYNMQSEKVNDLLVYRSRNRGKTWAGPSVPSVVDFSEHGFVPLISRFHPERLYNFGTVARPPDYDAKHPADHENAPIGMRWSDDDGYTWTEPQIIRPVNDPTFKAMSRTRMCETTSGAWLIGAHEGDWSGKPLVTRQYILRSTDQGNTWTLLPGPRPVGWQCPGYGRMDELRCLHLGNDEVYALARTPEGHLWSLRSSDAGATWTGPDPRPWRIRTRRPWCLCFPIERQSWCFITTALPPHPCRSPNARTSAWTTRACATGRNSGSRYPAMAATAGSRPVSCWPTPSCRLIAMSFITISVLTPIYSLTAGVCTSLCPIAGAGRSTCAWPRPTLESSPPRPT